MEILHLPGGFYMAFFNPAPMDYCELQVTSNFSFLRGASHPEELVEQAVQHNQPAIGITDKNTLAGIVRAHAAAKKGGIRLIPGCRLDLLDGPSLLMYPTDKDAYARLSTLLTLGNDRAEKGQCHLYKADVYAHSRGSQFIILPPQELNNLFDFEDAFYQSAEEYRQAFGHHAYLGACRYYKGDDAKQLYRLDQLAREIDLPLIATNDVHYHTTDRRQLQDVLTCIRDKCTIHTAGYRLHPNAERYMKPTAEMLRLFRKYPNAIRSTQELAEACSFSLDQLTYIYPREVTPAGTTPQQYLTELVYQGLKERFDGNVPPKIFAQVDYELSFIARKQYAEYFLTVYDYCRFARERGILYQGRGSAANCACCYYLGITNVDPARFNLLFERFMSDARNEPPDIDVDFEHERREEVIQYIYARYGRDRAAIVATVTQVHQKSAVRDVGKAMGLSEDAVDRLSKLVDNSSLNIFESAPGLNNSGELLKKVLQLASQYLGFPRQLGQHTGGFVITEGKLTELCPVFHARMADRTNIEWNKDDIDVLGFMKVDVLALGMLTAIRKAFHLCRDHYNRELTLYNVPQDDPKVYEMVSLADTIGVFQIESRAQQSMLPRLRPKCFEDLVVQVAIVRPGPIQGGMVHPYIRRRNGEEPITYPSAEMKAILEPTLGVPLFQEQAMQIAIDAAGFSPTEADQFRRSMATFKLTGLVHQFRDKLVSGMICKGYSKEYALQIFRQLEGFGSYGFPQSHAASFAHLVYISAWIKCHYPDVFAVCILNSLPMGFYAEDQLIRDAQAHGVRFLPLDVNHSIYDYRLERKEAAFYDIRVGLRQIRGIREEDVILLLAGRTRPYKSLLDVQQAGLSIATLELLADADAFRSMGLDRREALWIVTGLKKGATVRQKDNKGQLHITQQLDLFAQTPEKINIEEGVRLTPMTDSEHVVYDYQAMSISLKGHPVAFLRDNLCSLNAVTAADLPKRRNGSFLAVAGRILVRQRPGTAKGTCFITIEDETGPINVIVWASLFEQYKKEILQSKIMMVYGHLQVEKGVIHIIAQRCYNLNFLLSKLTTAEGEDIPVNTFARADERTGLPVPSIMQQEELAAQKGSFLPNARNFK